MEQVFNIINAEVNKQLDRVFKSFPSVFSKSDVETILQDLQFNINQEVEALPKQSDDNKDVKECLSTLKDLKERLVDEFDEFDYDNDCINYDSAEFSLEYDNTIQLQSVEFDSGTINGSVIEKIKSVIDEYIEVAEDLVNGVSQMSDEETTENN
jgi:hypothetical protein